MIRLIVLVIWILGSLVFSLLLGGILSFTNEAQSAEPKAKFSSHTARAASRP